MKVLHSYPPIVRRIIIFIVLFILVTGITGPWIIGTKLLYSFYFFIYGNLGKLVIFSLIAFLLLAKEKVFVVPQPSYHKRNLLFIFFSFLLIPIFFTLAKNLLTYPSYRANIPLFIITHLTLITIPTLLLLGVFTPKYLSQFIKRFNKLLLLCTLLAIIFDISIFYVWNIWPLLSRIVLAIVYFLFSLSFTRVKIIPPRGLYVHNFGVEIAQACSGIDSMYLFTILYLLILLSEWKRVNKAKMAMLFIPLLIGLFVVNILRVYVLILIGVIFSPKLTLQLFHTYLGMVLFIFYFLIFLKFGYKNIKKEIHQ